MSGRHITNRTRPFANLQIVTPKTAAETDQLYEWADFVVIPLKYNSHVSGITVISEAVLSGVPVICTDTGGLRAYFSDEELRYVALGEPNALREAILALERDPDLRYLLVNRAQASIKSKDLGSRSYAMRHRALSLDLLSG